MFKTLDQLKNEGSINEDDRKLHRLRLEEAKQHLRLIYKQEIKSLSIVADNCATFALSDPSGKTKLYRQQCNHGEYAHEHTHLCGRCEMVKIALSEFENLLKNVLIKLKNSPHPFAQNNVPKLEDIIDESKEMIEKIWEWKNHIIRTFITDKLRSEIITNLSEKEALIIMDCPQRFLRKKHHESQTEYFGKYGMNWPIGHVVMMDGGQISQHTFVHILRNHEMVNINFFVHIQF